MNTPEHYDTPIQPIDYIEANSLGFCEGNIIKYVTRYKGKNGLEDLLKARDYLNRLINQATHLSLEARSGISKKSPVDSHELESDSPNSSFNKRMTIRDGKLSRENYLVDKLDSAWRKSFDELELRWKDILTDNEVTFKEATKLALEYPSSIHPYDTQTHSLNILIDYLTENGHVFDGEEALSELKYSNLSLLTSNLERYIRVVLEKLLFNLLNSKFRNSDSTEIEKYIEYLKTGNVIISISEIADRILRNLLRDRKSPKSDVKLTSKSKRAELESKLEV